MHGEIEKVSKITLEEFRDFLFDKKNKDDVDKLLHMFNKHTVFNCLTCGRIQIPFDGYSLCNNIECRMQWNLKHGLQLE